MNEPNHKSNRIFYWYLIVGFSIPYGIKSLSLSQEKGKLVIVRKRILSSTVYIIIMNNSAFAVDQL